VLSLDKSRQQQFHDLIVGVSLLARNGVGVTNLSNSYTNRPISSKGPQRTHNGQCNLRVKGGVKPDQWGGVKVGQ